MEGMKMNEEKDFWSEQMMNIISIIETLDSNEKKILLVYLLEHMSMNDLWDVLGESIMEIVKNMQDEKEEDEGGEKDGK